MRSARPPPSPGSATGPEGSPTRLFESNPHHDRPPTPRRSGVPRPVRGRVRSPGAGPRRSGPWRSRAWSTSPWPTPRPPCSSTRIVIEPAELEARIGRVEPAGGTRQAGRLIRLPVLYDGEDLAEVAGLVGLTEPEVVERHSSAITTVFALGFLPGFPYAGYLPEPLAGLPRRSTPRLRVPAGSVAIAARQTGIYPAESPGGWRLLGRTPLRIVDLARGLLPDPGGRPDPVRADRRGRVPVEARRAGRPC